MGQLNEAFPYDSFLNTELPKEYNNKIRSSLNERLTKSTRLPYTLAGKHLGSDLQGLISTDAYPYPFHYFDFFNLSADLFGTTYFHSIGLRRGRMILVVWDRRTLEKVGQKVVFDLQLDKYEMSSTITNDLRLLIVKEQHNRDKKGYLQSITRIEVSCEIKASLGIMCTQDSLIGTFPAKETANGEVTYAYP